MLRQTRMFIVLLTMTFAIGILGVRLLWLQAREVMLPFKKSSANLVERSVAQRANGVVLDSGRGRIVDRSGEVLAGVSIRTLLLLPVQSAFPSSPAIRELSAAIRTKPEVLERKWRMLREPALWSEDEYLSPVQLTEEQEQRIRELGLPGAIPVETVRRYPKDGAASQLVGFVTEWPERVYSMYSRRLHNGSLTAATPIGASGLELAFDRFLQGIRPKAVVMHTDTGGNPLSGIGIRQLTSENAYYPLQLVTTLDLQLQQRLEEVSDRMGLSQGSIVVLDARTADVAAMVSRPRFDQNRAGQPESGWRSRALVALTPGSVFKSAIAAAALEEGVVSADEHFFCDGDFGKYGLTCWKKGGHGHVTFEEGFAKSCNIVFAEVAGRLSAERLNTYAKTFGLTSAVGWIGASSVDGAPIRQFPEEETGRLFARGAITNDGGVLAQTGIGQRDVKITPLAAANWVVTLLNDGHVASPRAASSIRFAGGLTMEEYGLKRISNRPVMSAHTARLLRSMMSGVVEKGTGAGLKDAHWSVAGKSGTAEVTIGGKPYVHQWFVGFGPTAQPRYAVAVVAEQRPPGSPHAAIPLFKEVMNVLAEEEFP